jgi:hypothetical protein
VHLRSADLLPTWSTTFILNVATLYEILLLIIYGHNEINAMLAGGEGCAVKEIRKIQEGNFINLN